jgi:hypothetical protein
LTALLVGNFPTTDDDLETASATFDYLQHAPGLHGNRGAVWSALNFVDQGGTAPSDRVADNIRQTGGNQRAQQFREDLAKAAYDAAPEHDGGNDGFSFISGGEEFFAWKRTSGDGFWVREAS